MLLRSLFRLLDTVRHVDVTAERGCWFNHVLPRTIIVTLHEFQRVALTLIYAAQPAIAGRVILFIYESMLMRRV